MNILPKLFLFLSSMFFSFLLYANSNSDLAVNLVTNFYEKLISFNYENEKESDWPILALSKSLQSELKNNEELCRKYGEGPCGLGGIHDLYTNNFEGEENLTSKNSNLTVTELSINLIEVKFNVFPSEAIAGKFDTVVKLKVIYEDNQWVVDDFIYGDALELRKRINEENEYLRMSE